MMKLLKGPARDMRSSSDGLWGISSICEMPPIGRSVISRTLTPNRMAVRLWANSWTVTQAKSRRMTRTRKGLPSSPPSW